MFALIQLAKAGYSYYDVCARRMIKSDGKGYYFQRKKEKVPVDVLATNESNTVLADIKKWKNLNLPHVALRDYNTFVNPQIQPSVKPSLCSQLEKLSNPVNEDSHGESDPFSSDDDIKDPSFDPNCKSSCQSTSKYALSSDEEDDSIRNNKKPVEAKKNCCLYCEELFSKIALHLERKHLDQPEVKKFVVLPKGTPERKVIIDTLRKNGNFLYTTKNSGNMIPVRRNVKNAKACPNCKGFFSATSLRKHYIRCQPQHIKGKRSVLIMSRKINLGIHAKACEVLKKEVFPVLREDPVVEQIRYDDLVIIYGNKMCSKYKSKHHQKMIRARLRLVGRFLLELKKIESSITDFASVFNPKYFDSTIKCINSVAQLIETTGKYKAPATAFALGTALKFISNLLISECIKEGDDKKQGQVENFLKLLQTDLVTSVNKTVAENQLEFKRQKQVCLPSNDDIKKLYNYLTLQRRKFFKICQQNCSKESWLQLANSILISIQLFNRRRAGEIERIVVDDLKGQEMISEDDDLFKALSNDSKIIAKNHVRFTIRGKLARGVPVLLHKEVLESLELLLNERERVGVPKDNPFLFGIPHYNNHQHLDAYKLLVKYSEACGAIHPERLRGTGLRKHIATQCIQLDLKDNEVKDLANYLGHAEKVHFDHYRMPVAARDITVMSRLLERAQGAESPVKELEVNVNLNDTENAANIMEPEDTSTMNSDDNIQGTETTRNSQIPRTPTKRTISRVSWITPERQAINSTFAQHIASGKLPTFAECRKAQEKFRILKRRTPPVIKSHVSNEIKRRLTMRQ